MLNEALKKAKKHLESLYTGTCTIYEYEPVKDPDTKRTISKEVVVIENQPCRVSYKNIQTSGEGNMSKLSQIIKLFLSSDVCIKPGSKIVVTQNNTTTEYKNTGEPAIYSNHQEIVLELFKGWA
ncbi:hypothetical protein [Romboutsia lituseburensis]|uniref:hypothetical protein n=1 Tax=Romboutsia lituseburensis TaxID=1537 RepID=UPI0022EA1799|nr:hypothetical protein [Romboutsia lituseburensis]